VGILYEAEDRGRNEAGSAPERPDGSPIRVMGGVGIGGAGGVDRVNGERPG